jgi:hypothetical protein
MDAGGAAGRQVPYDRNVDALNRVIGIAACVFALAIVVQGWTMETRFDVQGRLWKWLRRALWIAYAVFLLWNIVRIAMI